MVCKRQRESKSKSKRVRARARERERANELRERIRGAGGMVSRCLGEHQLQQALIATPAIDFALPDAHGRHALIDCFFPFVRVEHPRIISGEHASRQMLYSDGCVALVSVP